MKKLLLITTLLFYSTALTFANTIYVSSRAQKSGDGTKEKPFKSIQQGLDVTYAGDTLVILEGGYYPQDQIRVKHSGTPDKWVTIMGEPGKRITISGGAVMMNKPEGNSWMTEGIFHIHDVRYVKLENIQLYDCHNVAFMIYGQGHREGHTVVDYDNTVTHNIHLNNCKTFISYGSGIGIWYSDSVTVTNCEVVGANTQAVRPKGQPFRREAPHEAISIAGSNAFEIAYNHVHVNDKEGIDCKEFSSNGRIHHNYCHDNNRVGIYVDSWFALQQNVEVYSNIVHDCEWGICVSSEGLGSEMKNIRIHDNLFFNNRHSGYFVSTLGDDYKRSEIYFYNNTVVGNSVFAHWSGHGGGIDFRSSNIEDMYTFNNIVYDNTGFEIAVFDQPKAFLKKSKKQNILFKNNMIGDIQDWGVSDGFLGEVYPLENQYSIVANPLFINRKHQDFRLQKGSPAKGKSIEINGYGKTGADLGADIDALPDLNIFKY